MRLIVGISGIRGQIGQTLFPATAVDAGAAWASHLGGGAVVIGRDSRPSGAMLVDAAAAGLAACGCDVIDLGVVSTPGVSMMIRQLGAAGGMVVTASHNPAGWNGIKMLTAEGWAPPPEPAAQVIERFQGRRFEFAPDEQIGSRSANDQTHEQHVAAVLARLDVAAIRRRRIKVVLDSVNGAGGIGGRMLLERLGCEVVHINAEPTGRFAHPPEPIAEHLDQLLDAVRQHGAAVGFAQDPDADRLVVADEAGRFLGEEYTLALVVKHVLGRQAEPVACNLSTSRMIDDVAAAAGVAVHRTPVGEANVAKAMIDHHCVIGGEGNGGVIDPEVVPVRDSFTGMGYLLEMLAADGRPISAIAAGVPRYAMNKQKVACAPDRIAAALEAVKRAFADAPLNDADGVRIDWPEGWVHVRPSNTEPIMRIIAEARDAPAAEALIAKVREVVDAVMGQ